MAYENSAVAKALTTAGTWLCELLWPSRCGGCNTFIGPEIGFCAACQVSVLTLEDACPRCSMPRDSTRFVGHDCPHCAAKPWQLSAARSGAQYGGALVTAIVQFKHGRQDLLPPLAQLLVAGLSELCTPESLLVPVPLHPRRLRQRGFNQAWELARRASQQLPAAQRPRLLPRALQRIRDSDRHHLNGMHERRLRAEGAFQVRDAKRLPRRRVILVDDVLTTGATLNACASVLLSAGVAEVCAVTVARTV